MSRGIEKGGQPPPALLRHLPARRPPQQRGAAGYNVMHGLWDTTSAGTGGGKRRDHMSGGAT
eukprot:1160146-Pelagomonas_calceolata.AAC.2